MPNLLRLQYDASVTTPRTVYFSPLSVVLYLAMTDFLNNLENWSGLTDTLTTDEIDQIQELTSEAYVELMTKQIGQVVMLLTNTIPDNMLPLEGQTGLLRIDYPDLYDALPAFQTDSSHFDLPDFRSRSPIGSGQAPGLTDYNIGSYSGQESITLSEAELPSHAHTIPGTITTLVLEPGEIPALTPFITDGITGYTGGDTAHENRHPVAVARICIVAL